MAEEVERLVLAPFREIVEKGKTAIENVEGAGDEAPEPMLKAAQNLVKEGEKALKRIEPVSTANYEEYGSNFINAIKENDDIAQFRSGLEDLLWDIDDYIVVAGFDVEMFTELQKASKNAALKILDILKRMKLVAPAPPTITRPSSEIGSRLSSPTNDLDGTNSRRSGPSDPPSEPPPTPPSANPWQVGRAVTTLDVHPEEEHDYERRPPVAPDSPTIPQAQLVAPGEKRLSSLQTREEDDGTVHSEYEARMRAASQSHASDGDGSMSPLQSHRWTNSTQGSTGSMRSPTRSHAGFARGNGGSTLNAQTLASGAGNPQFRPDSRATNNLGRDRGNSLGNSLANNTGYPPRTTSVANQNSTSYTLSSRKPSTESINSSVFDIVELSPTEPPPAFGPHRYSVQSAESASTARHQSAGLSPPLYPGPPPLYQTPPVPPRRTSGVTVRSYASGGRTGSGFRGMDEGLIPVDMENSISNEAPIPPREPDCVITPSCSFYRLKGFCKGAEDAQHGQLGFKKIKRPMGGFSTATVAKCTHCLFELDYKAVEQDLNNESSGSFTSNTVGFRLRVLQKSHLPIRVIDEQMFACLFCIQSAHTIEESDATVFFSQRQLFAHMTRHPRPLPKVAGVTVIEEVELPPQVKDNFDLHFPYPPNQSVMVGLSREISRLPAAITTETRKPSHGVMRLPPDRQPALHFAVGAKIVGIEFPVKYEGKWAIGWHDGVRAAFEVDTVQLDAPPKAEVKMQGTSNVQAMARWKWNQKGDDRWLRFDKGDVIKNISWVYNDHWCWSGTTSKGSGVFPQSHLDMDTLRVGDAEDAVSVSSWEKKKNPLKFSLRGRKDDRKTTPLSP
ncbi:putative SH3 domain-containing protein [Rosellinia necatrix]|uniref:Putative SH3 domain-containing protein n=1 Tax=Rosellinia necatrix TaxID=77044 RepID=A0A1W2TGN9_ROSNE|nr:putative SH3 domain-containing protein [Rosellinia necatrix]